MLKAALDKLWKERQDFCLDVHFNPAESSPYIKAHDRYGYQDLEQIFDETDILVAPSIWYETFGYTVLEALSYGVPVIVSSTVGAKDILVPGAGVVIPEIDEFKLYDEIKNINKEKLYRMNEKIVSSQVIMTVPQMGKEIFEKVYMI